MHKSSPTLQYSKANGLFSFRMIPSKAVISLDNRTFLRIKNAWVENLWQYECINDKAVIQKDSLLQFIIDAEYSGTASASDYWLMEIDGSSGNLLGSILDFRYSGQDTIRLAIVKDKIAKDTILFTKSDRAPGYSEENSNEK